MTLNSLQIQRIVIYRGLGFTQQEIANKINVSQRTVVNRLKKLKEESKRNGIDNTFWSCFISDVSLLRYIFKNVNISHNKT